MTEISKQSPKKNLEVDIVCETYQTCQRKARGYKDEQKVFLTSLGLCHLNLCVI